MPFARKRTRNSTAAWMWLAIAAVAFTSVARAETGVQSSKGYSHPVFEFLARSQAQNSVTNSAALRFPTLGSRRQSSSAFRNSASGHLISVLPVLFIGLVSPFGVEAVAPIQSGGRAPASPLLSALFQRPPPFRA
ncbi:MAG TPA: hypothetical protein VLT57_07535 [Bryobacteraceae bacterium]|nr:hypothetical protein [Bryobacteraceae bacterium]